MNSTLQEKIKLLPENSGVYRMYDAKGEIIYVGKAVNLKNRVSQYFHKQNHPKVAAMVSHIEDFDYIITNNETEALTMESNLIKEWRPRYNVLLKDDKHFPYVRVDLKKPFPRFEVVRKVRQDGARYFGPYLSGIALRDALTAIRDLFPVRHCAKDIEKAMARRERPCLMYHLGKCCAPCSGNVSREEYHELLKNVCSFLEGHTKPITDMLSEQMTQAAEKMEFEKAAQIRDRIRAIESLGEKQRAISTSNTERDVFAFVGGEAGALIFALFVRGGKVVGSSQMQMRCTDETSAEVMASFLKQYYSDVGAIPKEIVVHDMPDEAKAIEAWLCEQRGSKVELIYPQRGEKRAQADLAYKNGVDAMHKGQELEQRAWERGQGALVRLCQVIGLDVLPQRMECYDNSHLQGKDTVGAMVVFTDGKPDKKEYRRFRIRSETNGDDYLAMHEMLTRRFTHAADNEEKWMSLPDLLVVDGGIGQLNVALEVLSGFGMDIPAIGLAEQHETIILPGGKEISLDAPDGALHLLERIRDEAHRFAITYHRSLRAKSTLYSELSEIEGIGEKRRRALFDAFLTMDAIRGADIEALSAVSGMNKIAAEAVYNHFHSC